ncbi:MAG: response regulator [Patescibacteria group bacterium]|jgi:twitching motility two-component system response regulator PilH
MHSILIIDDEPAIIEMYKIKLEQSQYKVFTALSGTAGIEIAKHEKPDIILLDIIMPKINGFDVLKILKEDPETQSIPVFMTTNLPEHTSGEKAKSLGAVNYLVKAEYEPGMVVEVLNRYLGPEQKPAV